MPEKESNQPQKQKDKELLITRVFDAPRELVFEAWTKPEHIKKWFAPHEFKVQDAEGNLSPEGAWRSSMKKMDGTLHKMHGVYQEIVPNEKLVFTHAWDKETGGSGHETVITVTFEDQGEKTKMHFHQAFFLENDVRDAHFGGWSECFEKLEMFLIIGGE